jgi:hypothetical protein
MAVESSTSATANNPINSNMDKAWSDNAKKVLMNMNTSDSKVYDFISNEFTSKDTSPQRQQVMMYLLGQRQQITSLLSNMLRMIGDGANQIIRNIRA